MSIILGFTMSFSKSKNQQKLMPRFFTTYMVGSDTINKIIIFVYFYFDQLRLYHFLRRDMHIHLVNTPKLFCDYMSALHMSINQVFHAKTKHIEIDYHFVRKKVALGLLITRYVPSQELSTDLSTKPLFALCGTNLEFGV